MAIRAYPEKGVAGAIAITERQVIGRGQLFSDLNPVAVDTPVQPTFDTITNVTPFVTLAPAGTITLNEAGNYHYRLSPQYGRAGSGGTAWIWLRVMVNGVQAGQSVLAKVINQNSDSPYQAELTADLPAGVVVSFQVWRGSEGVNDGGLITNTPLLPGANANPALDIIVSRYVTDLS